VRQLSRHPLGIHSKMQKIILHIFIILPLAFATSAAQSIDSTRWINVTNDSLGISFEYPSYFTNNILRYPRIFKNASYLEYLRYSPQEVRVNPSETIYLEMYSTLKIYLSKHPFDIVAEENNFIRKDNKWFDNKNPYEEPVDTFSLSDWKGLRSIRNTSIGIKGGGTWTSAADEEVLFLAKEIGISKSIVCFATGFNFPNAEYILRKICNSIIILKK
jgi:hypothetical protein